MQHIFCTLSLTFLLVYDFLYESVEYIVVVVKFKVASVSFGCPVICVKPEVFFHKSPGLSGGLLQSLRFILENIIMGCKYIFKSLGACL
jgi:hypothetical protein